VSQKDSRLQSRLKVLLTGGSVLLSQTGSSFEPPQKEDLKCI
jgi:hypothetical protein